jgi:serine phosphatase RsbU (regulator of sigma subunit)
MVRAAAARLGTAHTVLDVANATMSAATEFLGAITSSVWLVTDDRSTLEMRFEQNGDPRALALFARVPLTALDVPGPYVVETGEPLFLKSRRQRDELWPSIAEAPGQTEALVVLPLEVDGKSLGVVSFGFANERGFDDQDRVALLAVADQCAIGLDRARLYEATRERADSQSLLAAVSAINTTSGWEPIARQAVAICARDFVDTCAVYVREGHLVRRVAFASTSYPALGELLEDHFPTPINSPAVHSRVVREGRAYPVPPMQPDQLSSASPAPGYAEALRDVRLGQGWVFPLVDHGTPFGAMMFLGPPGEDLNADAAELARAATERTGNLIVSATAFAEQRAALAALQEIVLPRDVESIRGVQIVARYVPLAAAGTIGGDWWDALALPSGEVALAVGDVAGHGIQPAAVMGHARNALRMELVSGTGPADALTAVSTFLDWTHPLAHCTAIAATVSPATGAMRWASAGHPPPVFVSPDGTASFLEAPPAPPLGVKTRRMQSYSDQSVELRPGSTLLLYTDGLIEGRRRGIDTGMKVLAKLAGEIRPSQPLEDVADGILAALVDHQDDDVCLVALRVAPEKD